MRRSFLAPLAALLAVTLGAPPVHAAPEAPAEVATTPPSLESTPEVAYPEGAEGEANVVLVIVVDKEGGVRSVDVDAGSEPFAAAARAAAAGWRFTPATRAGVAVTARIRFAVAFHPPVPAAPPPPVAPAPAPTTPAAASRPPVAPPAAPRALEVLVQGERALAPSVSTLSRTEVRQLPGAFGDPFRAIEVLPGVTPIVSGLPYFYVRGAPPGNVGYFFDGVRVPYLFHVAIGPSVVHPALVERVDLYAGGYPAEFGRFAGAVVAADATAPRTDFHGEGNLRLFDAGAMVEGGFADGRGTALVGARYSYTAALLSLLSPTVRLDYRDYQARVTYDLGAHDRIGVFAFGSYDLLSQVKNGIEQIAFGSEFYRVDARWDHALPSAGKLRVATTWGFDQTRVGEQRNARDVLLGARATIVQPVTSTLLARGGLDGQADTYRADAAKWGDPDDPGVQRFNDTFPARSDGAMGAWADVVWKAHPRFEVTPGVRVDAFRSGGTTALSVDPRLATKTFVTDRVRVLQAFGLAHQPPSFLVAVPGLTPGSLANGLQSSVQTSLGVEADLPASTTASLTAFGDWFYDMTDALGTGSSGGGQNRGLVDTRSTGRAYGLELYVRRRLTQRLGGFLSYTLSRSTRTLDGVTFPASFDRTHVLNAALAFDLGRAWRAGTRVTLYTGAPTKAATSDSPTTTTTATSNVSDPARDPLFYRIDVRLEKRWQLAPTAWLSFVAEMLNATLHKEIVSGQEIGPVSIPSLGLEGGF